MVQETPHSRFADEHARGILIGFHAEHGQGLAAIESTAQGTRLSVLMPGKHAPVGTDHPSTDQAVSALATSAGIHAINTISSTELDAPALLRAAQPLALHLAERATINKLGVESVDVEDDCWILPSDPAKWPRYRVWDNGEVETVGTLFLIDTLRRSPVGWLDDPAGLADAQSSTAAAGRAYRPRAADQDDGVGPTRRQAGRGGRSPPGA